METMSDIGALDAAGGPEANAVAVAAWARSATESVEQEDVLRPVVVVIDGPAGAGKTTLAQLVSMELDDAPIVHMDDLYPGWDGLIKGMSLLVHKVLRPASRGDRAWYARYDWVAEDYAETVIVPEHPYLIIEGVGSGCGGAREYADVRIWLDAAATVRRARAMNRDNGDFGPHWDQWARQEREIFDAEPLTDRAHLVIETD